jgi:hypothetical protein
MEKVTKELLSISRLPNAVKPLGKWGGATQHRRSLAPCGS